jgi:hypothetical protein
MPRRGREGKSDTNELCHGCRSEFGHRPRDWEPDQSSGYSMAASAGKKRARNCHEQASQTHESS